MIGVAPACGPVVHVVGKRCVHDANIRLKGAKFCIELMD